MPPLPKGEARALPEAFSFLLTLQQRALNLGSPFGRAGAGASERVKLARPGTLHFSGELSRHAKDPILEGAVERSETEGVFRQLALNDGEERCENVNIS